VEDEVAETLSLFLFVHLALASDADRDLAGAGLGRTHHRILFLVDCQPGITVGEIVTQLRVTQQAIQGPLRELISAGLVRQDSSEKDRRMRHLSTTPRGRQRLAATSKMQYRRISEALGAAHSQRRRAFLAVMRAMLDEHDRERMYPAK
jgi:DNA-binding MarR family transcriptional regulator